MSIIHQIYRFKKLLATGIIVSAITTATVSACISDYRKNKFKEIINNLSEHDDNEIKNINKYSNLNEDDLINFSSNKARSKILKEPSITLSQYQDLLINPEKTIKDLSTSQSDDISKIDISNYSSTILSTLFAQFDKNRVITPKKITDMAEEGQDPVNESKNNAYTLWQTYSHLLSNKSLYDQSTTFKNENFTNSSNYNDKLKLYSDLIFGLLEWAEIEEFLVRPDVDISFNLLDYPETEKEIYLPISNFKFSFTVANLYEKNTSIFNQLILPALSEQKITISLKNGKIKHIPRNLNKNQIVGTAWTIIADENIKFQITTQKQEEYSKSKNLNTLYELSEIKFLPSMSKFSSYIFDSYLDQHRLETKSFYPSLTLEEVKVKTKKKILSMTDEQAKLDIERYHGSYWLLWFKNRIDDLKRSLSFLITKIQTDETGKKISFIEKFLNNHEYRNFIYNQGQLTPAHRAILDGISQQKAEKGKQSSSVQIEAFLESFIQQLEDFASRTRNDFTWIKKPTLKKNDKDPLNDYPTISFNFEQKIWWKGGIKFFLKGTWDKSTNTTSSYDANASGNKISFDMPSVLLDPTKVFGEFIKLFSGIGMFNEILPGILSDLKDFVGWEKIEIPSNDYISFKYEAKDSPISITLQDANDFWDYKNGEVLLAWKALDVKSNFDLKHFYNFFIQLFSKIQCYKKDNDSGFSIVSAVNNTDDVIKKGKENPIKEVVHVINSIFGTGYKNKSDSKLTGCSGKETNSDTNWIAPKQSENNPWNVFFQEILKKDFTIDSRQLTVGYPSTFYRYPEEFDKAIQEAATDKEQVSRFFYEIVNFFWSTAFKENLKNNTTTYKAVSFDEINKKIDSIKDNPDNYLYPIEIKDPEISFLTKKLFLHLGISYPNNPTVIARKNVHYDPLTKKFYTDSDFATTEGLIKNKDKLAQFIIEEYKNQNFTYAQQAWRMTKENQWMKSIDNEKIKVSAINLNVGLALEQVLQMNLNIGTVGSFALSGLGVDVRNLLADALSRDMFIFNINSMSEDGLWTLMINGNIRKLSWSPESDFLTLVPFKINQNQLKLGSTTKSLLGL